MFDKVLYYFKQLCCIPHGSGNTKLISDYCVSFAEEHSLDFIKDEIGNVIIFKDGTAGYENSPAVILQGHLDMVCVKKDGFEIDFEKQGLTICEDDEFIWAEGTSLGGDDGIAVAYALAILDSDSIAHPPLEVVFTVDEEVGMIGANAIDVSMLKAKMLINIDSEEEDTLLVSCAGGVRADIKLPIETEKAQVQAVKIVLSGLTGGHSGTEIDKGRLNAVITMAKLLKSIENKTLVSIEGGSADNAIPDFCKAILTSGNISDLKSDVLRAFEKMRQTAEETDPNMTIVLTDCISQKQLTSQSSDAVLSYLADIPDGVIAYSKNIDGIVQTSLNLGIIDTDETCVITSHALRSSVDEEKTALELQLSEYAKSFGAAIDFYGDYPAWEYKENSRLRDVITDTYEKLFGSKMKIASIHAGLECGLFCGKIDGLDCVSMGPNIFDIHTADEKLSKESAKKVFKLIVQILNNC
ncbi:MAG: aminoacyl-histidine dipeptidase [Faecalibacterium sp.]|nr:aminoacyl-histidine dipeptidase [Ruminococcus sp.]MCM1393085.1 aminoacyl-histidine dipeptidase [Ruminococcus sp.]MCM1484805.1 aminoacyl-histidine dipeptidase [Faecalibacterium sp.]